MHYSYKDFEFNCITITIYIKLLIELLFSELHLKLGLALRLKSRFFSVPLLAALKSDHLWNLNVCIIAHQNIHPVKISTSHNAKHLHFMLFKQYTLLIKYIRYSSKPIAITKKSHYHSLHWDHTHKPWMSHTECV